MLQRLLIRAALSAMTMAILLTTGASAQLATGKVEGTVRDVDTGQPLQGAQVVVEGTRLGNVTNSDGYYFILNVPPGRRGVTFTFTGYQKTTVANQLVLAGQTLTVDASLSSTVVQLEGITVEGEGDALMPRDNTVTKQRMTAEVIAETPSTRLEDLMVLQAGVQIGGGGARNRALRIRGGRLGEDGMVVDGVMVRNYTADVDAGGGGWRFDFEEGTQSQDATPLEFSTAGIEQVDIITGGFQAEFGNAQSGIVNIITKEGGTDYSGNMRFTSDGLNPRTSDYGYNQLMASIGGPVPGTRDNLRFFASGEAQGMEDRSFTHADEGFRAIDQTFVDRLNTSVKNDPYFEGRQPYSLEGFQTARQFYADKLSTADYPVNSSLFSAPNPVRLPGNWGDRTMGQGKVTFTPLQSLKFIGTANWSRYQHSYPQGGTGEADGNYFQDGIIDLNNPLMSEIYEPLFAKAPFKLAGETSIYIPQSYARKAKTATALFGADWDFYRSASNSGSFKFRYMNMKNVEINNAMQKTNWERDSFMGWSAHEIQFEVETYPNRDGLDTKALQEALFIDGDIYWKQNVPMEMPFNMSRQTLYAVYYRYLREQQHNFKADVDFQLGRYNRLKGGYQFTNLKNFRFTTTGGSTLRDPRNLFEYNPHVMAFYVQNRTDLGDFVFDYGIRYDQAKPRDNWGITNIDIWGEHVFPKTLSEWSPRFDVGFPVTDKAQLRFSYGVFTQLPSLNQVFGGSSGGSAMMNPGDLEYARTDAFEAGVSYLLTNDMMLDWVTYYKDITGNVSRKDFFRDYYAYKQERRIRTWTDGLSNRDVGNIKGMDLILRKRFSNNYSLNLMYTLQFSRTTASQSGSDFYEMLDAAVGETFLDPDELNPIDGDRTHQFSGIFNHVFPDDFRSGTLAGSIFKNLRTYAVFRLLSGQPSGGSSNAIGGIVYGTNYFRGRWSTNLDLRFTKSFRLAKRSRLEIFTEIFNALNHKHNVTYPSNYRYESYDTVTGGNDLVWSDDLTAFQKVRFNADFNADGVLTVEEAAMGEIAGRMVEATMDKRDWGLARRINAGIGISF